MLKIIISLLLLALVTACTHDDDSSDSVYTCVGGQAYKDGVLVGVPCDEGKVDQNG